MNEANGWEIFFFHKKKQQTAACEKFTKNKWIHACEVMEKHLLFKITSELIYYIIQHATLNNNISFFFFFLHSNCTVSRVDAVNIMEEIYLFWRDCLSNLIVMTSLLFTFYYYYYYMFIKGNSFFIWRMLQFYYFFRYISSKIFVYIFNVNYWRM